MTLKQNMKSDFDEFLQDEKIYEEVNDIAIKTYIQLISATHSHKIMPPFSLKLHS